jgi:hypothetical protein
MDELTVGYAMASSSCFISVTQWMPEILSLGQICLNVCMWGTRRQHRLIERSSEDRSVKPEGDVPRIPSSGIRAFSPRETWSRLRLPRLQKGERGHPPRGLISDIRISHPVRSVRMSPAASEPRDQSYGIPR